MLRMTREEAATERLRLVQRSTRLKSRRGGTPLTTESPPLARKGFQHSLRIKIWNNKNQSMFDLKRASFRIFNYLFKNGRKSVKSKPIRPFKNL
jgi:hypothetical protein